MARTIQQIKADMLAYIATKPTLPSTLSSTSQTSIWGQFVDAISSSIQVAEQLGDIQEARMNVIADEAVPGTPEWLDRQVRRWQYGDQINLNADLTFSYTVVDPTKRIVTRCAIQEIVSTREVLVKAAKDGGNGTLTKLLSQEKTSLISYLNDIKFAGIHIRVVSENADRAVIAAQIYYSGQYIEADVKADVVAAIDNYLANIEFNGTLFLTKLVDAIQNVTGVLDVKLGDVVARPDVVAINDPSLRPVQRIYEAQAGYIVSETLAGSTLNDTLVMISQ